MNLSMAYYDIQFLLGGKDITDRIHYCTTIDDKYRRNMMTKCNPPNELLKQGSGWRLWCTQ
ncbi:hypothetical protein JG687_00017441 [Phytophthora cactorum]|uniref:Uncharacterized protein n=1 Tax=Phytophthora cactorum TaxID=29920 RepID=A0A8T1TSH0_9STRA|nr:hypothetical protein JG687_00017441 [Phytophthora cactorum]